MATAPVDSIRQSPTARSHRSHHSHRSGRSTRSHFGHVRRNLLSWICWAVGLIFVKIIFAVSNVLLPVILLGQMLMLDNAMLQQHARGEWLWIIFLAQLLLFLHLIFTNITVPSRQSHGGLQWIVYCTIIAVVAGILFFDTLPQMQRIEWEDDTLILDLLSSRSLITVMWLTPLFYAVLTFRTLRLLFQQDANSSNTTGSGPKVKPSPPTEGEKEKQHQRKTNSATLDAALLQDMVWHTVIDMIDIVNMMFMDSAEQSEGASTQFLSQTHPEEVRRIQIAAGAFIILGLFFHQQSYPSIGCIGGKNQEGEAPDVVKARKRSAIISILLVDLPFFTIRTYIYTLALSIPHTTSMDIVIDGKEVHRPQLDKWWVKNILCMMLQAMQLRFVQQAEQERSQSLRWWDVRRQVDASSQVSIRRKGLNYNANLMNAYQARHMSQNKLEYAFAELGALNDMSPSTTQAASTVPGDGEQEHDGDVAPRRCRWRCRCCCRSCWSKSITSFQIFCHAVMGLVLGWFIAKVDFKQVFTYVMRGQSIVI